MPIPEQISSRPPLGSATSADTSISAQQRLSFVDNLRWTMIILVVSMHAAVTYSSIGRWYYMETPAPSLGIRVIFATYQSFLQAFFMGFLFFIAGYFVSGSFDKKGALRFLRDRLIRLGLPSLLYMLAIGPLTEYYVARSWSPDRRWSFLHEWTKYMMTGRVFNGSGPLWFCIALLIFSTVYCLVRLTFGRTIPAIRPLPSTRGVVAFIGTLALATFLVRTVQPMGTAVYNMQLCFFSQYVLLFCTGIYAYRQDWLMRLSYRFGMRWFVTGLVGGIVLWLIIIPLSGALKGNIGPLNGGLSWQSAAFCIWESLVCVGVCLGLIVLFRDRFNVRNSITQFLSDNAFAIYVIHPPVLIALSRALGGFTASPLLKFGVLTIFSFAASLFLSAIALRRIPGLKQILS